MVQKLRAVCDELIQTQIKDPFPALEEALRLTGPEDTLLITGSLYLVGETLKALPRIVPLRRIQ
jgi:folylpolyglutamate synthase/dihydropteroate synthase